MKWYFVRHGETVSNVKKIYAGWNEEGLTQKGIEQAKEAGRRLREIGIDVIYSSPLKRAFQTADIMGKILGIEAVTDESFKEMRLGAWEGLSEQEITRRFPDEWETWNTRPAELVLEGRETLNDLLKRVLKGIENIRGQEEKNASVLIVTHVAIIRVLLLYSQGMDLNFYRCIPVPENGRPLEIRGFSHFETRL